jgi:carboxypeptidase C (cathepsin A)
MVLAIAVTRKQADRVTALPGLTFPIFFNHYSGYLRGKDTDYLHYWLVESQNNPAYDPLVLWYGEGWISKGRF